MGSRSSRQTTEPSNPSTERQANAAEKLGTAELLARRLDTPMGLLGVIFLFVMLGQVLTTEPSLALVLSILGWIFWAMLKICRAAPH